MTKVKRKDLIQLIKDISTHRISHTERCTWEDMNHGGDCGCGVGDWPGYPGFKKRIDAILDAEKK